jgi:hypothetical protein
LSPGELRLLVAASLLDRCELAVLGHGTSDAHARNKRRHYYRQALQFADELIATADQLTPDPDIGIEDPDAPPGPRLATVNGAIKSGDR